MARSVQATVRLLCLLASVALVLSACQAPASFPDPIISDDLGRQISAEYAGDPIVVYERDNGIGGYRTIWWFYLDGRMETNSRGADRGMGWVPEPALHDVIRNIVDAGFLELEPSYLPKSHCCGWRSYKITVVYQGAHQTVDASDSTDEAHPQALDVAVREINGLIRKARVRR